MKPSGGDPDFASVVLLLDFAGADGATDITDLSNAARVETFSGNAEVDTAKQFLDENSLLCDGNVATRVTYEPHADFAMGTGDFTWECGVLFSGLTGGAHTFLSNYDAVGAGSWFRWATADEIQWVVYPGVLVKQESWFPELETWYHVAVCRSGTDLRIFVDGVQMGTPTTDSTDMGAGVENFNVGATRASTSPLIGSIGAVRITKGVARYTENFTAPTVFYPTS